MNVHVINGWFMFIVPICLTYSALLFISYKEFTERARRFKFPTEHHLFWLLYYVVFINSVKFYNGALN
jgi:hypothetical protein